MKTIITGILLIVGGIWARAHFGPVAALCRSGVGDFAQAFSSTARQDCGEAQTAVNLAPWAIGVGIVIVAGGVLFALGVLGTLAVSARKKPQAAGSKPRPAAGVRPARPATGGSTARPASANTMPRPAPGSSIAQTAPAAEEPQVGPV